MVTVGGVVALTGMVAFISKMDERGVYFRNL